MDISVCVARCLTADLRADWINIHSTLDTARTDRADMESVWREAGNGSRSPKATLLSSGRPLRDGETAASPMALHQDGPMAAVFFHNQIEAWPASEPVRRRFRRLG